uniref:NADH-ubiquinone oxidoreductase chain 2 n=1 Tax=Ptiliidae sp. BMNH 1274726 TaxID=1796538 RepID=A0A126TGF4_9COLE|nr:NADH dehydrogenase subunit 2 [Ptiliidae sp. BMNH 1274726]
MFFNFMILGILISISSNSWLGVWLGLEINLLSFIPLMSDFKNLLANESSMKYFITQVLASLLMLVSMISLYYNNFSSNLLSIALFLKMGAAPLHMWLPPVMEGLNWANILILGTMQKIAPMILISYNTKETFTIFILTSIIIGSIMSLNQTSMKKIMAYSAINHTGWMISTMMFSNLIWLTYFSIYSLILVNLTWIFKNFNVNHIKQTISNNQMFKISLTLNFWNLAGIPPFLGFWPKWLTIQTMVSNNWMIVAFLMIMFTIVMIFVYTRIMVSNLLMNTFEMNYLQQNLKHKNWTMNFLLMTSLILNTSMLFLF